MKTFSEQIEEMRAELSELEAVWKHYSHLESAHLKAANTLAETRKKDEEELLEEAKYCAAVMNMAQKRIDEIEFILDNADSDHTEMSNERH